MQLPNVGADIIRPSNNKILRRCLHFLKILYFKPNQCRLEARTTMHGIPIQQASADDLPMQLPNVGADIIRPHKLQIVVQASCLRYLISAGWKPAPQCMECLL